MISELNVGNKVIGVKQSRRAIKEGRARKAFLAEDAEERVKAPVIELCRENGTEYETVPTMKELGTACGIEVGSAVAVILK